MVRGSEVVLELVEPEAAVAGVGAIGVTFGNLWGRGTRDRGRNRPF